MSLSFKTGPGYLKLPREPQPWLIERLLPVGLTNLYGKPKSRKSFIALGIAAAIADGRPDWNGFRVARHGPVAYLQIDTPRVAWADRIEKLQNVLGYDLTNLHLADMQTVPYPFNILDEKTYKLLQLQLSEIKPVLTIIDTLRESFSGDENDSNTMRNVITSLVAAARWEGGESSIIFISHARKDGVMHTVGGAGDLLMDDARGSSYVSGRMDMVIKVTEKQMAWKGRQTDQQQRDLQVHPETGFVMFAGQQLRAQAGEAVTRYLLGADPIRRALATPGVKPSLRGVAEYLVEQGILTGASPDTIRKWPEFKLAFKQAGGVGEDVGEDTPSTQPHAQAQLLEVV